MAHVANTVYTVAILIDGAFFLNRIKKLYPAEDIEKPGAVAKILWDTCLSHLDKHQEHLYRILYYDCLPYEGKAHNPVSNRLIKFGETQVAVFRNSFFEELKRKRKVALRLGRLAGNVDWVIRPKVSKDLLAGRKTIQDLTEEDVYLNIRQKGIDIKIGLDIASMALKQAVRKIILISGDSDFVPASKLARREGIDFVLDPMWADINPDLYEHIDGLVSKFPRPPKAKK